MEYRYAESHEWARVEGNIAYVGISDHAQHELGDIVYVELPEIDSEIKQGEEVTTVESVKAAAAILSPMSGRILSVNEDLNDEPEKINHDAKDTFIYSMEVSDPSEWDKLMDEKTYEAFIKESEAE